ncbi:MAG: FGGY family carbohydrate kinase [Candidatus Cloacimonetes bacterium]|nr:FGGY family carbohydrate kinase [Candidatus Cloacimonadota bacterium]
MEKKYFLGIDVGTTGTKTLLFSGEGEVLARSYQGYETSAPNIGCSEQNAEDWWNSVCSTVRETCASPEISSNVAAISLSLQGGTMVAVDSEGTPVRPAIVWNDLRGTRQHDEFVSEIGSERYMYEKTGWELGTCLLPLDIRWMRENEPTLFSKTAMFLSVPDYISMKMTGIPAIDLSDAGINQTADIQKGIYDKRILEFAGISEKQLPRIVHSGDVIGHLTKKAAEELGLNQSTILVAGAHDQYAVALGAGAVNNGDMVIGSGTCWVVTALSDFPDFTQGLSQSVSATPGKWGSMLSLSSGGICLDWFRNSVAGNIQYRTIDDEVEKRKASENGLFFFPFSGQYKKGCNFTKASFSGLDLSHDRFDIMRSIMEGVVFQTVWMMESFNTHPSSEGIILSGGASKSKPWSQMLSDISGIPVRIPGIADLSCVGAAKLAMRGYGITSDSISVEVAAISPDRIRTKRFRALLEQYKALAGRLGESR